MRLQPTVKFREAGEGLYHCDLVDGEGSVIWTTVEPASRPELIQNLEALGISHSRRTGGRLTLKSSPFPDRRQLSKSQFARL